MIKKWIQFTITENIDNDYKIEFRSEVKPYLDNFEDYFDLETKINTGENQSIIIQGNKFKMERTMLIDLENILRIIREHYEHFEIKLAHNFRWIGKGTSNKKGNIQWQYDFRIDKTSGHERYHQYKYLSSIIELENLNIGCIDYITILYC
jgi:hypothetical protein